MGIVIAALYIIGSLFFLAGSALSIYLQMKG